MVRAQGRRATRLRYAPTVKYLFILKHFPTLLQILTLVFALDCARTVHEWGYCTATVHIGAAIRASAATGAISLARRLSFTSASRFICNFI